MLVLITIQDVNDHAPEFERPRYNASVPENSQRGIPIQLDGLQFIHVKDIDQVRKFADSFYYSCIVGLYTCLYLSERYFTPF